jgi:hypothetical protein
MTEGNAISIAAADGGEGFGSEPQRNTLPGNQIPPGDSE